MLVAGPQWRAAAEDLAVHGWDKQIVVYHRRSGDTHCLDRRASAVLGCLLEAGTMTHDHLRDRVAAGEPPVDDELDAILTDLQTRGLVRRIAEC